LSVPFPRNEGVRLKALLEYGLLDREAEREYDGLVLLASRI
jgi:hypothetical protein